MSVVSPSFGSRDLRIYRRIGVHGKIPSTSDELDDKSMAAKTLRSSAENVDWTIHSFFAHKSRARCCWRAVISAVGSRESTQRLQLLRDDGRVDVKRRALPHAGIPPARRARFRPQSCAPDQAYARPRASRRSSSVSCPQSQSA